MIEKFEVKIVRLKTGEDIICFCYIDYKENKIHIKYPKIFYFDIAEDSLEEELIFVEWLTSRAYASQDATLELSEVLLTSYCVTEFGQQYLYTLLDNLDPTSELTKQIKRTLDEILIDDTIDSDNVTFH